MSIFKHGVTVVAAAFLALAMVAVPAGQAPAHAEQAAFCFGSAATQVACGTYDLPATLMNASDITKASAAAGCVKGAELSVADDGSAQVRLQLEPIEMFGLVDAATQWKVYQGTDTKSEKTDAAVVKTGTYLDKDGKAQPFDEEIEFAVPDATFDGVYVNMFVSAMNTTTNAYLRFNYDQMFAEHAYTGTVQVDQFGKYDVTATVTVSGGKIARVDAAGENYAGAYVEENKAYMEKAIAGMKDVWVGMPASASTANAARIAGVDTVSGATFSSEAIRDAVLKALGMEQPAEVINVPSALEAGTYTVDISYYTDVVRHYLTGAKRTQAKLTVDESGNATIATEISNGVPVELYVTDVEGYYAGNDTSAALVTDGFAQVKDGVAFSDENFDEGTQVVWEMTMPLAGPLAKEYATRVHLYVPAMKNVQNDDPALTIDHGMIAVDAYLKVYWDTRTLVEAPKPAEKQPAQQQARQQAAVITSVTINAKKVTRAAVKKALGANAATVTKVTLGKKVKSIARGAFKGTKVTTLVVKTKKLTKKSARGCLKGSKVKTVKVPKAKKKLYKKIFAKKVCGAKVKVK